ncbi:MAG: hypothetical protein ACM3L6_05985, partial [Deltaproteobacteria bacterium]
MKNERTARRSGASHVFALDIGSKNVRLAAAPKNAADPAADLLIETVPSRGIFKGVVNDLAALSDVVAQAAQAMEKRLGQKVCEVTVAINGNYIVARRSRSAMALSERGTRSIT